MVLLKDKGLPPTKWALGRITELHPGSDDKVRLVSVRTKGNQQVKQPMDNLCPLPLPEGNDTNLPKKTAIAPTDTQGLKCNVVKVSKSIPPMKRSLIKRIGLLFLLLTQAFAMSIIKPNPGLYIEKIGECQVRRGVLRLQLEITYDEMQRDAEQLDATGNSLTQLVATWNMRNGKASEQVHFQQMYAAFHRKRQHVADHIPELRATRLRNRPGLLGKLMTGLFGVNDEVYAELDLLQKHQIAHIQNDLRLNSVHSRK